MYSRGLQLPRPGGVGLPAGVGPSRRSIIAATYRWSGDGAGRRKRESLLDNAETAAPSEEEDRVARVRRRREERRRQRDASLASAGAQEGWAPPPGATAAEWDESEWGPAAPVPPEVNEYGWAGEAWDGNGSRRRRAPEDGDDGAWADELRRRERRRRSGAAASTSQPDSAPAGYTDDDYDEYDDAEEEEEEPLRRGGRGGRGGGGGDADGSEPDIALLSPQELERVLPVVPFSAQATYFNGGAAQGVQRWGASLALTVLLSKVAVLAAGTLTWPLWWPWAQAASKNYTLRKQTGYAGLWRTEILQVEAKGRPRPDFGAGGGPGPGRGRGSFSTMRTTRIVLGDPGGAQTEFVLPQDARYDLVQPGQAAELIVLADAPSFESFRAVKDVYLPDCGLWLSEYPYLDRTEFLELSLEVEREAAAAAADGGGEGPRVAEAEVWDDDEGEGYYDDGGDEYYNGGGPPRRPPPPPRY